MDVRQALYLAGALLGCVLGAGFSSGQEHLRFFLSYGFPGFFGMVFAGFLFFLFGLGILEWARTGRTRSHHDLIAQFTSQRTAILFDRVFSLFLFGALAVMYSAGGVIFQEGYGLPYMHGVLLLATGSIIPLWGETERLLAWNGVLMLLLVFLLLAILFPVLGQPVTHTGDLFLEVDRGWIPDHWALGAALYVTYNMGLAISPFAALGQHLSDRRSVLLGMLIGAAVLTALGLLMLHALTVHQDAAIHAEAPLLAVARILAPRASGLYVLAMLIAALTSCIAILYGLVYRVSCHTAFRRRTAAIVIPLAVLPVTHLGFGTLVGTLYPSIGYISSFFLLACFAGMLRKRRR